MLHKKSKGFKDKVWKVEEQQEVKTGRKANADKRMKKGNGF